MGVAVVNVRVMRVRVQHWFVSMKMGVRCRIRHGRIALSMSVSMVFIMHVTVAVLRRLVAMRVLVPLGKMQPHPDTHQNRGNDEEWRRLLAKDDERQQRAHERGRRKVGARASGTEMAERQNEEHQTHAVTQQSENESGEG
jgi:hypothetical protein